MKYTVFVYGTLKQGKSNHNIMSNAEFLGKTMTEDDDFDLIDLGAFPAAIDGYSKILGEIYRVNESELQMLDRLEGNGTFFQRILIHVEQHAEPVWLYKLMPDHISPDIFSSIIPSSNGVINWVEN